MMRNDTGNSVKIFGVQPSLRTSFEILFYPKLRVDASNVDAVS